MVDINYYKELVVEEESKVYSIKLIDFHNKRRMLEFIKNDVGKKNVGDIIFAFLNSFSVNGINKTVPLVRNGYSHDVDYVEILLSNNTRKINMKIYSPEFKFINKISLDNYTVSRSEFFKDESIKEVVIGASFNVGKFEKVDGFVNLNLMTDLNMNIRESEREFFREFLEYRCFGKKINVELVIKEDGVDKQYVATCGDLKIVLPIGYTYSTIMEIINEHNKNSRKRR